MKNERTYCKSCCSPQRTIRDRAGLRCSACERLLVPLQHRRHRPVKNASHSRVKEFSAALRESLDRQPLDLRHPLKIQQRDELLARRDYLLTPNGGRFQIEQGSIADRFIREQEVA
jgi:hypothetical protein